ncbi:1585_t:CDS:2 [Paraglomus occultum]|uniref:1585_t:CDS:1 n=1 Tax=Paraglomus occultum TaxID=144539 RepID=A0A9N9FET1_9GLOM|nr:1585_t:CDS:2 [Paraglomus occultum]
MTKAQVTKIPILTAPKTYAPIQHPSLSVKQEEILNRLSDYVKEILLTDSEKAWANEACLQRYLRASKWHLDEAMERIKYSLEWRRTYKPEHIDPKEVEPESVTGKMHINGFDKHGRPIIYLRPGRENTKAGPGQVRHVVFYFESAIRLMPEGTENIVVLIDFHGASARTSPGIGIAKEFMHVLSSHYPEQLGLALVVNAPWYFWVFFRLISPFIDPVTKAKIKFVDLNDGTKAANGGQWTTLDQFISQDMLEREYGGNNAFEYHHETYWSALLEKTNRETTRQALKD